MRKGFSLIEMIVALSLGSFVLVGVTTIVTRMARTQMESIRSGTATGWVVASYMSMAREIEDANVLAYPPVNPAGTDQIIVCKNWTRVTNTRLDLSQPVVITQYCFDNTDPSPESQRIRRFSISGNGLNCPTVAAAVPTTCTATPTAGAWGAWTDTGIVGFRVERNGGQNLFMRDNGIGGMRLRYVLGTQNAATNPQFPVVKFTAFDIGISMSKQYSNTLD